MIRQLYVGNLPKSMTEEKLSELFSTAGTVESCMIIGDMTGKSRGFGFVTMSTEEASRRAVQLLHGKRMGRQKLEVREDQPELDREVSDET